MSQGRPPLPIGTYRSISSRYVTPAQAKARARFRDYDGVVRTVARFAPTREKAEDALRQALRDRQRAATGDMVTPQTSLAELADLWLAADHDWSTGTRETYEYHVKHVKKALGDVRVGELRLVLVNRALGKIRESAGAGAAKTTKTVLSGMCEHAIAFEAIERNYAKEALPIVRAQRKERVRALTEDETADLLGKLYADPLAADVYDLAELADWMLGTGSRIGEATAARAVALQLVPAGKAGPARGTWEINATVKRIRVEGLTVQQRPKTAAGWRVLALPPNLVTLALRRLEEPRFRTEQQVVFGAAKARALRDPSNTAKHLRAALDRLGYDWVTSHVFRKTVATRLEDAGLTARQIADVLGHAKPSMTQDVYLGRNVVSAEAAAILAR